MEAGWGDLILKEAETVREEEAGGGDRGLRGKGRILATLKCNAPTSGAVWQHPPCHPLQVQLVDRTLLEVANSTEDSHHHRPCRLLTLSQFNPEM
jgi:hypothetical protein